MGHFLRAISIVVTGGVALVGALYLTHGLIGHVRVNTAKEQAAADLEAALPEAQRQATADREHVRNSLADLGASTHSWQELVCELDTNDSGWMVDEYVQECNIRSVDLVPTARAAPGDCEDLYVSATLNWTPTMEYVGVWRGRSKVLASEVPWTFGCPDGLTEPPLMGTSRLLRGQRPENLSAYSGWTVIVTSTRVSRTVLGCDPWGIVFCNEPIDAPEIGAD